MIFHVFRVIIANIKSTQVVFSAPKRGVIHVKEKNMLKLHIIIIIGFLIIGISAGVSVKMLIKNPKLYDKLWKVFLFIEIIGVIIAVASAVAIVFPVIPI